MPSVEIKADQEKNIYWMSSEDGKKYLVFLNEVKLYREELLKLIKKLEKETEK